MLIDKFVQQQGQALSDLEQMKAKLARLKLLITNENINEDNVRPHLKTMINEYPHDKKRSPDLYSAYLWNVLLEKTPSEHYIIEAADNNELSRTLDLIFGDATKGIRGLDAVQQHLVMYAFNTQRKQLISSGRAELSIVARWKLVEDYLDAKGIKLGAGNNVPNTHLVTIYETAYLASKLPSRAWRTIIEHSTKQKELENTAGITDETRAAARQQLRYAEQMMGAATHLSLSLYGAEVDTEKQKAALAVWKGIAQSIFANYPQAANQHVDALINFVTQTLMVQLGINQLAKEDRVVLEQIVRQYMGIQNYAGFPLPFTANPATVENRIACLADHLVLMISTLSPPAIKTSFGQGIIRLMSRDQANSTVTNNNKYVIRLSNKEPDKLVVTTSAGNNYITSASKQTVHVADKDYAISTYPEDALKTAADPHVTNKVAIVPNVTLEQMTSVVFQREQAEQYREAYVSVNYYSMNDHAALGQGFFRSVPARNPGLREAIQNVEEEIPQRPAQ